jgi:transposase
MWVVPEINGEFVERMEDVLRVYARPYDPKQPVVCLDERPVVLRDAARAGTPMRRGRVARSDYEYVRKGTANVFCVVEPKTGKRLTRATRRRTNRDFARMLLRIVKAYPKAKRIHLVVDNLSSHSENACVETFGERKGRRLWRRFKVHFTPKHGSWLNAAEMEASLLGRQCLGKRRIPDLPTLCHEVRAWRRVATCEGMPIRWKFRVKDARRLFKYDALKSRRSEH